MAFGQSLSRPRIRSYVRGPTEGQRDDHWLRGKPFIFARISQPVRRPYASVKNHWIPLPAEMQGNCGVLLAWRLSRRVRKRTVVHVGFGGIFAAHAKTCKL